MSQRSKLSFNFGLVNENPSSLINIVTSSSPSNLATQAYVNSLVGTSPSVSYTAGTGLSLTNGAFSVNATQTGITSVGTLSGLTVSSKAIFSAGLDVGNTILTGLSNPINPTDGANKAYVDSSVSTSTPQVRSGTLQITNTTASTSASTGALQVSGGLGLSGTAFIGGGLLAQSTVSFANAQFSTPVSGSTIVSNGNPTILIGGATTLPALTIAFPASPVDGQLFRVNCNPAVTALTVSSATFPSNGSAPTTLTAGQILRYIYNTPSGFWWSI